MLCRSFVFYKRKIFGNLKHGSFNCVRRISIRRNEQIFPTKHIILIFNSPNLLNRVNGTYLSCPIRPYIPNPLRCFQCQDQGLAKISCRESITCARSAEVGHDNETCEKPEHCFYCKGNHPAYSRTSPKWILEKWIQTVKIIHYYLS